MGLILIEGLGILNFFVLFLSAERVLEEGTVSHLEEKFKNSNMIIHLFLERVVTSFANFVGARIPEVV